jgi:hypothetical protein
VLRLLPGHQQRVQVLVRARTLHVLLQLVFHPHPHAQRFLLDLQLPRSFLLTTSCLLPTNMRCQAGPSSGESPHASPWHQTWLGQNNTG